MRIVLRPGASNVFGPALKRAREASRPKLTQDDVAARITAMGLPIDRSTVSRIENQKRALYDFEFTYFCHALGINMARLVHLSIEKPGFVPSYEDFATDDPIQIKVAEDEPDDELLYE